MSHLTSQSELVTVWAELVEVRMESFERILDEVVLELEQELSDDRDPLMALAGCVGTVLLHWEGLDDDGRRALIGRIKDTVHTLETRARLSVVSAL